MNILSCTHINTYIYMYMYIDMFISSPDIGAVRKAVPGPLTSRSGTAAATVGLCQILFEVFFKYRFDAFLVLFGLRVDSMRGVLPVGQGKPIALGDGFRASRVSRNSPLSGQTPIVCITPPPPLGVRIVVLEDAPHRRPPRRFTVSR